MEKLKEKLGQDPSATTGSDVGESIALQEISQRLHQSETLEDALVEADLVIEAIAENLPAKEDIFSRISKSKTLPANSIITSNTSSFSIKTLSKASSKELFGLHFFNPAPKMKLVEIITIDSEKEEYKRKIKSLEEFVRHLGKEPIICKDFPGFVVNRLLVPYLMEAIRLLEQNIASKEDIDKAMKLGAAYPMGPFALIDLIGLDTVKSVIDGWAISEPNNPLFKPSHLLSEMVKNGKLGKKSGEGFYKYSTSTIANKESKSRM